jgi:hypothetical protein
MVFFRSASASRLARLIRTADAPLEGEGGLGARRDRLVRDENESECRVESKKPAAKKLRVFDFFPSDLVKTLRKDN